MSPWRRVLRTPSPSARGSVPSIPQTWYRSCCLCDCAMYIFGCGVVFGSHGGCVFRFVVNLLYIWNMCVCVLKVCAAAQLVVLLWVRLRSMWCELFATCVTCFVLASWFVVPPVLSCSVCSEVWLVSFVFLIAYIFNGFSQWRVVVGYALQVSPAVTRLTVYRRLQVLKKTITRTAATV